MKAMMDSLSETERSSSSPIGVLLGYSEEEKNLTKRGIAEIDENHQVVRFLEKPQASDTASRYACPPVYVFRSTGQVRDLLHDFFEAHRESAIENRDAPGKLIAWLVNERRLNLALKPIFGRFDVGSIGDYRLCSESVWSYGFPRLGLMGNPSDSCEGKCITVSFHDFAAVVRLSPTFSSRIVFVPNERSDRLQYSSLSSISTFAGGLRLMKAAICAFRKFAQSQNIVLHDRGFEISYESTIPLQVGLAGSSALICAALRSLEKWYQVSLPPYYAPLLMLHTELDLLGVSAGLMDRVIQWHEGFLFLDFTPGGEVPNELVAPTTMFRNCGNYQMKRLDELVTKLPPLTLYYSTAEASESGAVHSDVRKRYYEGDAYVRGKMRELANKADIGYQALVKNDQVLFARTMLENFNLRYELYGVEKVGHRNLEAIRKLEASGFAGKFTGSGGAIVAAPFEPSAHLTPPDLPGYTKLTPSLYIPNKAATLS